MSPLLMGRPSRALAAVLVAVLGLLALSAGPAHAAAAVPATPDLGPTIDAYQPWDPTEGTTCKTVVQPGIVAIMDVIRRTYPAYTSFGTLRACSTTSPSGHQEGRALDWMVDSRVPAQKAAADAFIGWLLATDAYGNENAMARRLGVMYLIYDSWMWRAYDLTRHTAPAGDPHIDHIHLSLGWPGALAQTSFYTGGTAAAATGCQPDSAGCPARRLGGPDRYATSVAIGQAAYPTSSAVVIASGEDTHLVDGLVAAPLGRSLKAPVLLTQAAGLPASVAAEVARRAPATAYLVGGTAAVGPAVAAQLASAGVRVVRLAGADRYATAAAIARQVGAPAGVAVVAPGADDQLMAALLAGGPAAALAMPVLLTGPALVPGATAQAITSLGVRSTYVVGGVPSAAAATLPTPTVLQAPDVYALSALLADTFAGQVDPSEVALASGAPANLVDSLPGGVLGRIILLTTPSTLTTSSRTWLADHTAVGTVTVLGGTGAVSDLSARAAADTVTR